MHTHVHIDSAHRARRASSSAAAYTAHIGSIDGDSAADVLRNAVALRVIAASVPHNDDNVSDDACAFRVGLLTSTSTAGTARTLREFADMVAGPSAVAHVHIRPEGSSYFARLVLSGETTLCRRSAAVPLFASDAGGDGWYTVRLHAPGATTREVPCTNTGKLIDPIAIGSDIGRTVEMGCSLTPGSYATEEQMTNETLGALQRGSAPVQSEPDLATVGTDGQSGWSISRGTRAGWTLTFLSVAPVAAYDALFLIRDRGPSDADILTQLGLPSASSVVAMRETLAPSSVGDEMIVGTDNTGGPLHSWTRLFETSFAPVDLMPVRYVDVVIANVPSTGAMYTNVGGDTRAGRKMSARVDLTSVSYNSYVSYKAPDILHLTADFEPVHIHSFNITLVDNFGRAYVSARDHTLHLVVTRQVDSIVPSMIERATIKERRVRDGARALDDDADDEERVVAALPPPPVPPRAGTAPFVPTWIFILGSVVVVAIATRRVLRDRHRSNNNGFRDRHRF